MIKPRVWSAPKAPASLGAEAVELSAAAGLDLDAEQAFVLKHSLGVRSDGKWASVEVGVNAPRQNGKGGIIEARALAGLFLVPTDDLAIYSAHLFKTASETQMRIEELVQSTPELHAQVRRYKHSHGDEGIYLKNGRRLLFMTRTKGGGRGLSCDLLFIDEAMFAPERMYGALLPTMSAMVNPQWWLLGSAVDRLIHEDGVVFARARARGIAGTDPSLAWFEWSVECVDEKGQPVDPDAVPLPLLDNVKAWKQANWTLGERIAEDQVARERRSMDRRTFAVERLGIGAWPDLEGSANGPIRLDDWRRCADPKSGIDGPFCLSYDVTPEQSHTAIAAVGRRTDGKVHGELIEHRRGTKWVCDRLLELRDEHRPTAIVCDGTGPAKALLPELREAGLDIESLTVSDHAAGCGMLVARVDDDDFRHLGDEDLETAIRGAKDKPAGEAWKWTRSGSSVNIAPLVAVTMGLFGFYEFPPTVSGPLVAFA